MSRKYDPTKVHRHWVYSRADVRTMFGVADNTITNWIAEGLEPVDNKRPQVFAGSELRRFITQKNWPHGREPEKGRLYCWECIGFKPLVQHTIRVIKRDILCPLVTGKCITCHNMLQAHVPETDIEEIHNAAANIHQDSSVVSNGRVSGKNRKYGAYISPESTSSNLRWLYDYRIYLEKNKEFVLDTVDEHHRSVCRMSAFFKNKPYEKVVKEDAYGFKDELRRRRDVEGDDNLTGGTIGHILNRCSAFFVWLGRQPGVTFEPDLPGYFRLSRKERAAADSAVKGTRLTFDQALCMFTGMPRSSPLELRNRAIVAMFITTGIRIGALISLRGKHVNMATRWINQDQREVDTKNSKRIRTYCLDLGSGLLDALREWSAWRKNNGFGDDAPFFPPDKFIQENVIGLGYRSPLEETPICWKSEDPVRSIIKNAAEAAGIDPELIASHDFRKVIHPFLAKRGNMNVIEEVALQLNFGHAPVETIRKHYSSIPESDRESVLDDLCRRALWCRSDLDLYVDISRNKIPEDDPDYPRARKVYLRYHTD